MKYSLRSLMTFSIREVFLVTVIVALMLGWWINRQSLLNEFGTELNKRHFVIDSLFNHLTEEGYPGEWSLDAVQIDGKEYSRQDWDRQGRSIALPNSSAPALIPPKP